MVVALACSVLTAPAQARPAVEGNATLGSQVRSDTYHARTGRYPVICTRTNWWNQCVSGSFGTTNPLCTARYADSPGELPRGWLLWTFWQHSTDPLDRTPPTAPWQASKPWPTADPPRREPRTRS